MRSCLIFLKEKDQLNEGKETSPELTSQQDKMDKTQTNQDHSLGSTEAKSQQCQHIHLKSKEPTEPSVDLLEKLT